MITQKEIDRINELAHKAKTPEGLTPEELSERAMLRRAYIEAMKASLTGQLEHTVIQYPDGTRKPLQKKKPGGM